jgi:hypothetical protein
MNHVAEELLVGGDVLVAGSAGYESACRSQIARFDGVRPSQRRFVLEHIAEAADPWVDGSWATTARKPSNRQRKRET